MIRITILVRRFEHCKHSQFPMQQALTDLQYAQCSLSYSTLPHRQILYNPMQFPIQLLLPSRKRCEDGNMEQYYWKRIMGDDI